MNNQETTLMERAPFLLPDVVSETEFSQDELAEDMDGLQLGFQRVKIPSGGQIQFEIPSEDPDNPDYTKFLDPKLHLEPTAHPPFQTAANEGTQLRRYFGANGPASVYQGPAP